MINQTNNNIQFKKKQEYSLVLLYIIGNNFDTTEEVR